MQAFLDGMEWSLATCSLLEGGAVQVRVDLTARETPNAPSKYTAKGNGVMDLNSQGYKLSSTTLSTMLGVVVFLFLEW